jgi:ribose transport system permease protein
MSNVTDTPAGGFDEATEQALTDALDHEIIAKLAVGRWRGIAWSFLQSRNVITTVAGLVLFAYFSVATPTFLSGDNILNLLRNLSYIGIVAAGMTCLFIAGELDLSVGSVFGFLTVVMGALVVRASIDPWLAMPAVILLGVAVGALNGLVTTRLGIPSFVVTLGGFTAYRSLALIVSGQQPSAIEASGSFYDLTGGYAGGSIPWLIIWMLVVMVVIGVFLAYSRFGYHAYATGGNLEAARNSGIRTRPVKLICFMLTSGLCGLVAALIFGYLHVAAPITGTGFEFRVIGAVIVGGVALTGGRGSVYGTLVGAIIIGIITNGVVHLGLSQYYGDVATGLLIMTAGALDLFAARSLSFGLRRLEV